MNKTDKVIRKEKKPRTFENSEIGKIYGNINSENNFDPKKHS